MTQVPHNRRLAPTGAEALRTESRASPRMPHGLTTPEWSMPHFDMFLKVTSPRFVGELTPKVNSRPESETIVLLVV